VEEWKFPIPMLVDTMDNQFEKEFAAWPLRFYVIQNNKLVFKAQPDADYYAYDVNTLGDWLETNLQ